MKSYVIKASGTSKIAASLASQLAEGKAGEILIKHGFSQETFTAFIANLAFRAVKAGMTEPQLAAIFKQVAACNASQARQAMSDITIAIEGEKEQSLNSFWGVEKPNAAPDLSLLGNL
jgi:hypothetical protein